MSLATLTIDINAKMANLERDMGKVAHISEQAALRMDKFFSRVTAMAHTAAATGALAALATQIQAVIDSADAMNDMSVRTGASIESLAALDLAAQQSGTSLDDVAKGLSKMAISMVDNGAALKSAGIDAKTAREAFYQFADVIEDMPSDAPETIELVRKVLGKSGDGLIPLLKLGSEGLREAERESLNYAKAIATLAPKADEFNDSMSKLSLNIKAASMNMVDKMMPGLVGVSAWLNDLALGGDKAREAMEWMAEGSPLASALLKWHDFVDKAGSLAGFGGDPAGRSASGRIGGNLAAPPAPAGSSDEALNRAKKLSCQLDGGTWDGKQCIKKGRAKPEKSDLQKFLDKNQQSEMDDYYRFGGEENMYAAATKNADLSAKAIKEYDDALKNAGESLYAATAAGQWDKLNDELALAQEAFNRGFISQDQLDAINSKLMDTTGHLNDQNDIGKQLGMTFSSAFEDAIVGGKKFSEVLNGLAQDILRLVTRKNVTEPLATAIGKFDWSKLLPSANGNVFSGAGISAFSGQVVSKPTLFPSPPESA